MNHSSLENRFMEFRLGGRLYALPLLNVKEVIQKPDVTEVPNMPNYFEGMINLRGQILGVFNVRKRIGEKPRDANASSPEVVIVLEHGSVTVGMVVDEVTRVLHPDQNMLQAAPLKEDDPARKYISAVIKMEKDLILIMNIREVFELDKYKAVEKAA